MEGAFRVEASVDITNVAANVGAFIYLSSSTNLSTFMAFSAGRDASKALKNGFRASVSQGDFGGGKQNFSRALAATNSAIRVERDPHGRFSFYSRELPDGTWSLIHRFDKDGTKYFSADVDSVPFAERVYVGVGAIDRRRTVTDVSFSNPPFAPLDFEATGAKNATTATLVWSNAANHVSFKVCYRNADAGGDWITVAEGLAADTTTYAITSGLEQYVTYEAKIIAVAANGDEAESEVKTFACGQTGLYAAVMGPVETADYTLNKPNQCRVRETLLFERPYLNLGSGSLFTTTNLTTGVVCWRGSISIPETGSYTFTGYCNYPKYCAQGCRLAIDGTEVFNKRILVSTSEQSLTGTIELAAGVHPIEVDFYNGKGVSHFELHWKKPSDETSALIPISYFRATVDESDLPCFAYDDFEFRFPGTGSRTKFPNSRKCGEGLYELTGVAEGANGNLGGYGYALLGKTVKGPFKATFTVNIDETAASSGKWPVLGFHLCNSTYKFNLSAGQTINSLMICTNGTSKVAETWISKTGWRRYRVMRTAGNRVKLVYSSKNDDGSWGSWVRSEKIEDDGCSDESVFVGIFNSTLVPVTFHDFTVEESRGLMILLR